MVTTECSARTPPEYYIWINAHHKDSTAQKPACSHVAKSLPLQFIVLPNKEISNEDSQCQCECVAIMNNVLQPSRLQLCQHNLHAL